MRAIVTLLARATRALRLVPPAAPRSPRSFDAALRRAVRNLEHASRNLESPAIADDLDFNRTFTKR